MTTDLVDADKVLYRDQRVLITLPNNTFPVEGEIFTLSSTHMIIDVDRRSVPVGFVPPTKGMEVQITLHGVECMYHVSVHLQDALPEMERMWRFERPRCLIREQKRKHFRVPVKLPLTLSMTGGVGTFDNSVEAETVDISAGGVCFKLAKPVAVGQTLFVIIEKLPGLQSFPVLGDVVRCVQLEEGQEAGWQVALNLEPHLPADLSKQLAAAVLVLQKAYLKESSIANR